MTATLMSGVGRTVVHRVPLQPRPVVTVGVVSGTARPHKH